MTVASSLALSFDVNMKGYDYGLASCKPFARTLGSPFAVESGCKLVVLMIVVTTQFSTRKSSESYETYLQSLSMPMVLD